jgi:DNA-directed RNA polymerase subunit beta'
MGHIELATPVSHVWFLKSIPSRMSIILGISANDIEKVIYFAGYVVTSVSEAERERYLKDLDSEYKAKIKSLQDEKTKEAMKESYLNTRRDIESIQAGKVLDEVAYHNYSMKYSTLFEAGIGAEAIYNIFKNIDMKKLLDSLIEELEKAPSVEIPKINKRISTVKAMINSSIRPEWMFLTNIPVIPPALRPMVPLDGGRYATSDINDLYRRVINRNNRLKKLIEIGAPDVILRNEKRILQEAVDALIDNGIRHTTNSMGAVSSSQRRELKSLADNLKGKKGIFRQNLLGKRVDYSARSVIVVGPELKLHQCGLPKHMALELFRPFVISVILKKELSYNIRGANKLIEDGVPEVWAILEDVIKGKYVLLNRAPTLHRLGIQAFQPILIEGNAIQLHPLVCSAFNADFDGDQMAVHLPLSDEAQLEAREIMSADKNILKPGSGIPTISDKLLDIVLGVYWMTKDMTGEKGEGMVFPNPNSAITAYEFGLVSYRAKVKVLPTDSPKYAQFEGKLFETTVGRLLFNSVLPKDYPYINNEISKSKTKISSIIDDLIERYGLELVPPIVDKIKAFGFKYSTKSGVTWGMDDVLIPEEKFEIIENSKEEANKIVNFFEQGLISEEERLRMHNEIWYEAKSKVENVIKKTVEKDGSVYDMVISGARGSFDNITKIGGITGLIQNASGEIIEFPIVSCFKEGFSPIEYFITTHGSRKGLSDTALSTAKAGYLTRRLFVVAQDIVVTEDDCGSTEGITISKNSSGISVDITKHIKGRFLSKDVVASDGRKLFDKGHYITKNDITVFEKENVNEVTVRSPLGCKTIGGVCVKCYGSDLGKNKIVDIGEAVGTVAGQAIGEPGTQLTMNTKHAGGSATAGGDVTQGLPRVEELFEKRKPKNPAVVATVSGTITDIKILNKEKVITVLPDEEFRTKTKGQNIEYSASLNRVVFVKVGDKIKRGDIITDGSADIDELFKYAGKEKTINYIISEINKPYDLQGATVARKHIELIVRQMFSRKRVKDSGDTGLTKGDYVDDYILMIENNKAKTAGKEEAKADPVVMGISEVSLTRRSFLAAASFQHTPKILIQNALKGSEDKLTGLMENVIIGKLIPAGTGFKGSIKNKMIEDLKRERENNINNF